MLKLGCAGEQLVPTFRADIYSWEDKSKAHDFRHPSLKVLTCFGFFSHSTTHPLQSGFYILLHLRKSNTPFQPMKIYFQLTT